MHNTYPYQHSSNFCAWVITNFTMVSVMSLASSYKSSMTTKGVYGEYLTNQIEYSYRVFSKWYSYLYSLVSDKEKNSHTTQLQNFDLFWHNWFSKSQLSCKSHCLSTSVHRSSILRLVVLFLVFSSCTENNSMQNHN